MEKYKIFTLLLSAAAVILILMLLFRGEKLAYVCYDGTMQQDSKKCPSVPSLTIDQKKATDSVNNYARAYANSKGDTFSVVNVYRNGSIWRSDVLFSNAAKKEVHSISLSIDGTTATVTCTSGCDYLNPQVNSTNTSE
jgi:hypothetical protein